MPRTAHPRPRQDHPAADPFFNAGMDIAADWEAHLDAGRIRNHHACAPEIAANRARTATLFLRIAKEARR